MINNNKNRHVNEIDWLFDWVRYNFPPKRNYWFYYLRFALCSNEISVKSPDAPWLGWRGPTLTYKGSGYHPGKFVCLLRILNRQRKHNAFQSSDRPVLHPAVHCPSDGLIMLILRDAISLYVVDFNKTWQKMRMRIAEKMFRVKTQRSRSHSDKQ